MNIPRSVSCGLSYPVIPQSTSKGTQKEAAARRSAENAQSQQDKLMRLYTLSGQGFNAAVAEQWSRELGRPVN